MKRRNVKLAPPAYMHYMRKGWLDSNPHKALYTMYKRRCQAPPTHVYYKKKRGQAPKLRYTQHEYIYRGDVKLPLHIGNIYQQILKPLLKQNFW